MTSYINYVNLAGHMVDYLMAIAAASLTVLTLIMAFDKKPANQSMHPLLICSLIVAVIASFVGTSQMSTLSSLEAVEGIPDIRILGQRTFYINYVNVIIASNYFIMAMLLLAPAYEPESAKFLRGILQLIFSTIIVLQVVWTLEDVFLLITSDAEASVIGLVSLCLGLAAFFIIMRNSNNRAKKGQTQTLAFKICVIVSMLSPALNLLFPEENDIISKIDVAFFSVGSCLVLASIGCLGWVGLKDMYEEVVQPERGKESHKESICNSGLST